MSNRWCNNSGSSISAELKCNQVASPTQWSPISGRSGSFSGDDVIKNNYTKYRKNIRLSIEEKIHEHLSSRSNEMDSKSVEGTELKKSNRSQEHAMSLPLVNTQCKGSSIESIGCSATVSGKSLPGLSEVESGSPLCSLAASKPLSLMNARSNLNSCALSDKSDISIGDGRVTVTVNTANTQREFENSQHCLRRRSCELALEHGRLSPKLE